MFIVDIPGHHGEEARKRKRIMSGRENTSKPKLVSKPGGQSDTRNVTTTAFRHMIASESTVN